MKTAIILVLYVVGFVAIALKTSLLVAFGVLWIVMAHYLENHD